MERQGKCIIVAAGDFTPVEIEKREGDLLIAADGGFASCEMVGVLPDLIIGDFDSAAGQTREQILTIGKQDPGRVIQLPKEKDDTDTLSAIRIGLEKGYKVFYIYGALGGRLDHTIANLQCLRFLKNHGARAYIMAADCMLTLLEDDELHFHPGMQGTLSVFCIGEKAEGVTLKNLKYELENGTLTPDFPIGVSNEFTDKPAVISVKKGVLLIYVGWS